MKIGDRVYVHGHVDEIRKDTIIIQNSGGYFGTDKSEIVVAQKREDIVNVIRCKDCKYFSCEHGDNGCVEHLYAEWTEMWCNKHFDKEAGEYLTVFEDDYCSWAEPKDNEE